MTNTAKQSAIDKKSLTNLSFDLLISALAGTIASLLILLGAASSGKELSLARLANSLSLIFSPSSNEPDKIVMELVVLAPILISVLTIAITRNCIQRVDSRRNWIPAAFIVALVSTILSVVTAFVVFTRLLPPTLSDIFHLSPFFLFCILIGSMIGIVLGIILVPERRIFKIAIAVVICILVAGLFEYHSIWIVVFF